MIGNNIKFDMTKFDMIKFHFNAIQNSKKTIKNVASNVQ